MSASDLRVNDPFAWIDEAARQIDEASVAMIAGGEASRVSDAAVAQLMTAAIRLYAAKTDGEERTFSPLTGRGDGVSATELLTAVSELLRAQHLSPMELALWFRHRPEEMKAD
ncbi:MAG: hypothetical protein KDK12_13450 [Rhodobacteraceae bacterium]|nr:hypothetical protein [Paracoccaceae bacterium]